MRTFIRLVLYVVLFLGLAGLFAYGYFVYTPRVEPPQLAGSYTQQYLTVGSLKRRFSAYVPSAIQPSSALVFVLHGSLRSGESMRRSTGYRFDELAEQYGFVVIYPDGIENHWNDCRGSADYAANILDVDDASFFSAMINTAESQWNVDPSAIFVTGISNGGHMAYRLAMERPDEYLAIAAVAANLPQASNRDCLNTGQAISVAVLNGTQDGVNPWHGGTVSLFGNTSRGEVLSTSNTMEYWLSLAFPDQVPLAETIEHPEYDQDLDTRVLETRWSTPESQHQFRLYALEGSGHVFPMRDQRFPRLLGASAGDISGPDEIVEFFLSHLE